MATVTAPQRSTVLVARVARRSVWLARELPVIEVHMTNVEKRGTRSVLAVAAVGVIAGFGVHSYLLGIDAMVERLR